MQRYFITDQLQLGIPYAVDSYNSHHILRVMRGKVGDTLWFVDCLQQTYLCELIDTVTEQAMIRPITTIETTVEFPHHVAIACGLSKSDKIEWIVQKATECGMHEFIPVALERDVMKWTREKATKKIDRLNKIAKEAAEQSHRQQIPVIQTLTSLESFIENTQDFDIKLIAYEETAKHGEHHRLKKILTELQSNQSILMIFGSEGGLSANEVKQLTTAGFVTCSLGPRILRAETAPIYFLSALSYQIEL